MSARRPTPYTELAAALTDLPAAVRTARRQRGLTRQQVADRAGVSASTVGHLEAGGVCNTDTAHAVLLWLGRATGQLPLDGQP